MATAEATQIKQSLQPMQTIIKGKVIAKEPFNGEVNYVLTCPAKDEYSHPSTVSVRSSNNQHQNDDVVTMRVELGGMPNNFTTKDGRQVKSANMWLTEIV